MLLDRVKPLDAILATAEKKSLHRSLGALQLTLFGIGCIIGTGIFVLTAAGAQKAGPGLMLAFIIAGAVCIVAALCYAEIAAMVPVAGSAYTYSYATMGEFLAWTVGWALVLEYAIAASAVSVGWSGFFSGTILHETFGISLPAYLTAGPLALGGAEGLELARNSKPDVVLLDMKMPGMDGLEVLPRRQILYHGRTIEEFDLEHAFGQGTDDDAHGWTAPETGIPDEHSANFMRNGS